MPATQGHGHTPGPRAKRIPFRRRLTTFPACLPCHVWTLGVEGEGGQACPRPSKASAVGLAPAFPSILRDLTGALHSSQPRSVEPPA